MRIALLVTDLERGGTPLRIARLARGLRTRGVEAHVGCLARLGPVGEELAREGIATFACDAASVRDVAALWRLARHLKSIRPDLLHATLTHANVAARVVGGSLRIPVLTSTATIEVERRSHLLLEALTAHWDRGHVVNSAAVAEHVRRRFHVARRRIFVIPPAVDVPPREVLRRDEARASFELEEHEFAIVWAGRFDVVKRLPTLIECAELLNDVPSRFFIAGDGPEREKIERQIRTSGAGNRITLLGWRDDVRQLYVAADAMIFPSLTEGMPNAVLEAMACSVCVIGSDIPVLRELAGDGSRLVLTPGGEARQFAAVARELWRDSERRRAIGDAARHWAEANLSVDAAVRELIGIYERTLSEKNRSKATRR